VRKLSADYVFPLNQAPVKNGIVVIDEQSKIVENIIDPSIYIDELKDVEHFTGFICPGFINTHCHLELSYLKGKMKEHSGLDKFIIELEQVRKGVNEDEKTEAVYNAENEMMRNGIVANGDISNNNSTFSIKNKSNIYYHTFIESFASDPLRAEKTFNKAVALYDEISLNENNSNASITPHAPYSLSKNLFLKIKEFAERSGNILSIHHQESEEENKFFLSKNGNINDMHFRFGVEKSDFGNSGLRPLAAIADYLPKNNPLQLVHNTVADETDISFAEGHFKNLYWCFCPNANLYIEQKLPDFALFFNNKCKITIGTDSLASNKTLSILDELKTIHANVPFIPLNEILKWAVMNGAEFLQISNMYGSFEKGKCPGILLLENVDSEKLHITKDTTVKVLG
jgi:aminodeoxyfutalosine deaminase